MKQLETEIAVANWKIAEDDEVKEAMRQTDGWKTRKLEIGKNFLSYKAMMETWHPSQLSSPGSVFKNLESEIEEFDEKFEDVMIELRREDKSRNLFTLEERPASLMEYPLFGGKDWQCYFQYEEKMIRALKINKVPLIDQVAKIRESLSGHPLDLIPESMKLAKVAFQTLRSRYGDEERVLALRLKELKKSGKRPDAQMAQVAW